jgi:hypothetical protein
MVLGVLYLNAFGLPINGAFSDDWKEDEIEKEMLRLYRHKRSQLPPPDELSEMEMLELDKLERLHEKRDFRDDYV